MTHEETDSPGCCLAIMTIVFFFLFFDFYKTETSGMELKAMEEAIQETLMALLAAERLVSKSVTLEQEQGMLELTNTVSFSYSLRQLKLRQQQKSYSHYLRIFDFEQLILKPVRFQPTPVRTLPMQLKKSGFMPYLNSECFFSRFIILKRQTLPLQRRLTEKQKFCWQPWVFTSDWSTSKNQPYFLRSSQQASKLPPSKRDQNCTPSEQSSSGQSASGSSRGRVRECWRKERGRKIEQLLFWRCQSLKQSCLQNTDFKAASDCSSGTSSSTTQFDYSVQNFRGRFIAGCYTLSLRGKIILGLKSDCGPRCSLGYKK